MNPITALITIVLAAIGGFLFVGGLPIPGIVVGLIAVFVAFALKMANNWERFVILRAGKLSGVKGPGLFMIVPVIDAVTAVIDERIQTTGFNAEQALTVGSTHRDMPHQYGVSYFSSKGPTGDGRVKPDLVAPGERILSCAAGKTLADVRAKPGVGAGVDYVEDSGTSMSAAHVSGVIAAFLSIRREFIGCPTKVKDVFTGTATDLGRITHFQGHGLIDLMRAIQSV